MNQQTKIYECSRDLATKKISNSEWVNTWNDGIKLEKGDTVRLLGSFVNEDGDSQDIQILENSSFTIEHIPYINADTVIFETSSGSTHKHANEYQMKLGDIASPVYATDAYGIEPPYWAYNHFPLTDSDRPHAQDLFRQPLSDRFCDFYGDDGWRHLYDNHGGGADTGIIDNEGYDYAFNDFAIKLGCYIDTATGFPQAPVTLDTPAPAPTVDSDTRPGTLGHFNTLNLDQTFQIAHLCKLISFPVFKGIYYETAGGVFNTRKFSNRDYLSVGDYISTYYIAKYPQIGNPTASMDAGNTFGNVNWNGGPRSVVGKILAVKKSYRDVHCNLDNVTRSMEFQDVYVYEFVNPASYKEENENTTRPRHGSSFLENGYNPNRNDNRNAGVSWNYQMPNSYPHDTGFFQDNYDLQLVTDSVMNTPECGLNPLDSAKQNMRYEVNTSLSFLWTCRPTDTRPLCPNVTSSDDGHRVQISSFVKVVDNLGVSGLLGTVNQDYANGDTEIYLDWNDDLEDEITLGSEINFASGNVAIKEVWNYKNQGYFRIVLTAPVGQDGNAGDNLDYQQNSGGVYWYPRQYEIHIEGYQDSADSNRKWSYQKVNSTDYNYWGAICRMNPSDDNNSPYVPDPVNPAIIHRLYIPFTQQTVINPYKARNFINGDSLQIDPSSGGYMFDPNGAHNYSKQPHGSPNTVGPLRFRQNFGVSTGRGAPGNSLNHTAPHKPVPYNLTDTDGWGHHYTGKDKMINPQGGNSYSDSVCSIHIQQPFSGSAQYDRATNTDTTTITNRMWISDLIYVKKFKTEIKPKPGYYNFNQVAEDINNQLHFNYQDYSKNVGKNTTVTERERQPGVSPNIVYSNFVHSYLPDITYGFFPLTQEIYEANQTEFNQNGFTTWRTTSLNNYLDTFNTRNQNDSSSLVSAYDSSINIYFVPCSHTEAGVAIPMDKTTQFFRLNGAKLIAYTNTNSQDHQASSLTNTNCSYDFLNTISDYYLAGANNLKKHKCGTVYRNRTTFNNFTYGGCAKIFVGAVNPTFKINTDLNRMVFEYLYTPYRPATDDTGSALSLVSGQAVPSAIIDAFGSGGVTDGLSGIYIRDLASSFIDNVYQPTDFLYKGVYSTDNTYQTSSEELWNTLGFTNTQLNKFRNNSDTLPFLFINRAFITQDILYNVSELDSSVNATNPFYSYCSLVAPNLQFSVEVESNEIIADDVPLTLTTPFYLIGSDFPAKEYYGGHGTKLPVIGICSRQFSSFGYVFDLSESSVTYTIDSDITITSIHTKLYNNDMTIPLNLGDKSSVIYVVTKPAYYSQLSEQEIEESVEEANLATQQPQYEPQMFYYPNPINYEAPLFLDDETDDEL